jgi:WD40 repeat protein
MYSSGCRDGSISLWHVGDLSYIGNIVHHDKSTLMVSSMVKSMSTYEKAAMKMAVGRLGSSSPETGVMITAMTVLSSSGHLCVASADCSMSVYDLATQEVVARLNNLTDMITSMCAFLLWDRHLEAFVPHIVMGDVTGHIYFLKLNPEFGASSDGGVKKRNQILLEKAFSDNIKRIKFHDSSVTRLSFIIDLGHMISSSMDGKIIFINLDKFSKHRTFGAHRIFGSSTCGVKCFNWAPVQKYVCSAGTDRLILMWDPYTLVLLYFIKHYVIIVLNLKVTV